MKTEIGLFQYIENRINSLRFESTDAKRKWQQKKSASAKYEYFEICAIIQELQTALNNNPQSNNT